MTENPRPEKVAVVTEVREKLDSTSAAILAEYRGLNVDQLATLRNNLRDAGGEFKVYKNTLVRLAARDLDLEIEDLLTGPTALAFVTDRPDGSAGDAVDIAKALKDFGKDHPALVVKGGVLGDRLLSADDARSLADVEPREVLLAKLAGGMAAPMQKFAGLLQALPRNFAYGLKALIDQGGAEGAPSDPPAGDDTPADEAPADEAPADEAPSDTETSETAPAEASEPSASEAPDDTTDSGSVQGAAEDSGATDGAETNDQQTQEDSVATDSAADEAASNTEN